MAKSRNTRKHPKDKKHSQKQQEKPHSWAAVRSLFTCKYLQLQQHQHHVQPKLKKPQPHEEIVPPSTRKTTKQSKNGTMALDQVTDKKTKKLKCSGSLCSNTKVMQKPDHHHHRHRISLSPEELQRRKKRPASLLTAGSSSDQTNGTPNRSNYTKKASTLSDLNNAVSNNNSSSSSSSSFTVPNSTASPSISGSFRNMPFRKLSGCYECRMVVDPVLGMTRDPSLRASVCSCPDCGEIFMKAENLELHQAVRHAVSEVGPEDTSKNIVEIIFQSSWLKKQAPVCQIDRILKVQNTPKTISKFEEYRDTIKAKATRLQPKKHPRCLADGNELLRFHCTTLMCSLGLNGSSNLCNSMPSCGVCSIIKNGFKAMSDASSKGILTTATSGKAHDSFNVGIDNHHHQGNRAMLVCRVIAGRVKKNSDGNSDHDYDSVGGVAGVYSNLDELYVFNPKAILPCFVVIYRGF